MPTSIPRNWRTRKQRLSLSAEVCEGCGTVIFPPRDVCPTVSERSIAKQLADTQKTYEAMLREKGMDHSHGRRS